jgi:hypothetical protein
MALMDDIFGSTLGIGVIGVGAILLAPTLLPTAGRILRPVVKQALRGGIVLYEGISSGITDVVAEATNEMEASPSKRARSTNS